MPSYYSIHFGCRANQADAAAIESDLAQNGFSAASGSAQADVVVLNSCTVTASADSELRQTVRRIHRQNPQARILVTGCYAQRRPEEIAALPGVEWVVGNSHKAKVANILSESSLSAMTVPRRSHTGTFVPVTNLQAPEAAKLDADLDSDLRKLGTILVGDISSQRTFASSPYLGGAVEDRTRPNLKIQDGCDSRCSFCIIPSVRGLSRSLPADDVIAQVRALTEAGYREVVLSGVNLGQYGRDLDPSRARQQAGIRSIDAGGLLPHGRGSDRKSRFVHLIQRILEETPVERLRLSSIEPMDFSNKLLDLMASTPRIARHVHAPLQSGSDRILRRMHRKYRAGQYRERILAAHDRMPDAAFGADVIVGFPGETGADFEATRRLIEELPFIYLHVFPYSRRPGTPADTMKNQVNGAVARERGRILRDLAAEKNRLFRERQVVSNAGSTVRVLTLGEINDEGTLALTSNYLKVRLRGEAMPANEWIDVRIISSGDICLIAERAANAGDAYGVRDESPSIITCASA